MFFAPNVLKISHFYLEYSCGYILGVFSCQKVLHCLSSLEKCPKYGPKMCAKHVFSTCRTREYLQTGLCE